MPETQRQVSTRTSESGSPRRSREPVASTASDGERTGRITALAVEVRSALAKCRRALDTEVRLYPTPIPRCDAQFNHLYEQRSQVSALLGSLDAALECGDAAALAGACAEFIRLPPDAADPTRRRLCDRVEAAIAITQEKQVP